ncbi:MAG TPA: hypothetical protein VLH59_16290 [Ignavibacteriaceae bacterium]|nr:hypothetical protein [Ignavibacteriaceae bacterium]
MKFIDLMEIIQDEKRSEDFLRSRGVLKTFTRCSNCGGDKLGLIRGDRWKCYNCKSEWTRRKDSILSLVRMKYSEFILCMKFFELELTAEETSLQMKINYRTVQLLFNEFRIALTSFDVGKMIEDKVLFRDEELIYLTENGKKLELTFTRNQGVSLAAIKMKRHFLQQNSAYYDIELSNINRLHSIKINRQSLNLHSFLRFAKRRLYDFKGTGKKNLLLRLMEIEFRFNNSGVDVFDRLGKQILKKY